jgi:hypothetical protein
MVAAAALLLAALCVAISQHARAPRDGTIRVLITDGHSNHDWKRTTALVASILRKTGLFSVDVSTAPARKDDPGWNSWCPRFSDYDVVIQNYNDLGGGALWPEPACRAFEKFVRKGGGIFILHSANNAFPQWEEYNRIIGMGWRPRSYGYALRIAEDGTPIRIPPGSGNNTWHGSRTDRVIHLMGNDPVHQGMPREWLTPLIEVYTHARGPAENVSVLSWAEEPATHERWPIEWTVRYGKGRVYNSILEAMAPDAAAIEVASEIVLAARAAQWAPISHKGQLHDRASYRFFWQVLERAHSTGCSLPAEVQLFFKD